MHKSYFLTMITSIHQAKLIKENMPRGLEWFIEELKPLSQKWGWKEMKRFDPSWVAQVHCPIPQSQKEHQNIYGRDDWSKNSNKAYKIKIKMFSQSQHIKMSESISTRQNEQDSMANENGRDQERWEKVMLIGHRAVAWSLLKHQSWTYTSLEHYLEEANSSVMITY